MTDLTLLEAPAAPLLKLGSELGIDPTIWSQRETLRNIQLQIELPIDGVHRLDINLIKEVTNAYQAAFTCKFELGVRELSLSTSTQADELHTFQDILSKWTTVACSITLDKTQLAVAALGTTKSYQPFLYLFSQRFEEWLTNSTSHLETELWKDRPEAKRLVILSDRDILLDGSCLTVVGGRYLDQVSSLIPSVPSEVQELVKIYASARATWETEYLRHITPIHLELAGNSGTDDRVARRLSVHLVNTILLYSADRTTGQMSQLISTFTSPQQSVEVPHADLEAPSDHFETKAAAELLDLFRWTTDARLGKDKLALLRLRIIPILRQFPESDRCSQLLNQIGHLTQDIAWSWQGFINKTLDEYDKDVRDFEKYVRDSANTFTDQATKMVDSLNAATLAAVGALVGSFIAAMFKDKFDGTVFSLGMIAYAIYLLFFPLSFGLISQHCKYKLMLAQAEAQRVAFARILTFEQIKSIYETPINRGTAFFRRTLCCTGAAYVIVAICAVIAAFMVPKWVANEKGQTVPPLGATSAPPQSIQAPTARPSLPLQQHKPIPPRSPKHSQLPSALARVRLMYPPHRHHLSSQRSDNGITVLTPEVR